MCRDLYPISKNVVDRCDKTWTVVRVDRGGSSTIPLHRTFIVLLLMTSFPFQADRIPLDRDPDPIIPLRIPISSARLSIVWRDDCPPVDAVLPRRHEPNNIELEQMQDMTFKGSKGRKLDG
jgi:hypothetical protein